MRKRLAQMLAPIPYAMRSPSVVARRVPSVRERTHTIESGSTILRYHAIFCHAITACWITMPISAAISIADITGIIYPTICAYPGGKRRETILSPNTRNTMNAISILKRSPAYITTRAFRCLRV
jgi:hypothetical protein